MATCKKDGVSSEQTKCGRREAYVLRRASALPCALIGSDGELVLVAVLP
jgi:hypothetical protein